MPLGPQRARRDRGCGAAATAGTHWPTGQLSSTTQLTAHTVDWKHDTAGHVQSAVFLHGWNAHVLLLRTPPVDAFPLLVMLHTRP